MSDITLPLARSKLAQKSRMDYALFCPIALFSKNDITSGE